MTTAQELPSIKRIAELLGGEVRGNQVVCPGPQHSDGDRSLSVKLDGTAPDGFVVHSFAGDDPIACRDHVRSKLGLPELKPKRASGSASKNKKGNRAAKTWSPIIA